MATEKPGSNVILEINFERLQQDVETLAAIGVRDNRGLFRMAFSDGDMAARQWISSRIEEAGLDLFQDGAANIHARYNWRNDKPSVVTGSHIDTVPGAGHLDGALGVLAGLECLRTFAENKIQFRRPLEAIAFTDEEGRFGGMFGSQAICGMLTPGSINQAIDLDNISISDAMKAVDLNAMDALKARRDPSTLHSFVELHIEQGPVLDSQDLQIGVVDAITGLFKWTITLSGQSNHAGTTPMHLRQDAMQGLAEVATQLDRVLAEYGGPRSVATIGRVELRPGAANVVPGVAEFTLEVRDTDPEILRQLADAFRRVISAIARRRGLMFEFEILSEIPPVKCDPGIVDMITGLAEQFRLRYTIMPSGAAHDTQMLANITPAAMIFIPSMQGRSHSPEEWSSWQDIKAGANLLLQTLYNLAEPV